MNDCLISIGGGITGDVSGFAASLFKRGLKFVNIPILLTMDSSIGGKLQYKIWKKLNGNFTNQYLLLVI